MKRIIDKEQFGPWALVTGASSGIGREFARQLASAGFNVVLVARRQTVLEEVGSQLSREFGVEYRAIMADLSQDHFLEQLAETTAELDIGLVVSNAGDISPGPFLSKDRDELASLLRLNTFAHLAMAHHFSKALVARGRGGLLFVGAMGAETGVPYMANDAAARAYIQSLAQALHVELKPFGVRVAVLAAGPTETPLLAKLGMAPETMPMKPMNVRQCVSEGLLGLQENRSLIIPGRTNRIMKAIIPASITREMMKKLLTKAWESKSANSPAQAELRSGSVIERA
jgi:short-subunit dehydrogenase